MQAVRAGSRRLRATAKARDCAARPVYFPARRARGGAAMQLLVALVTDAGVFERRYELFQPVQPGEVEVVLRKANGISWAALEKTDAAVVSWTTFGIEVRSLRMDSRARAWPATHPLVRPSTPCETCACSRAASVPWAPKTTKWLATPRSSSRRHRPSGSEPHGQKWGAAAFAARAVCCTVITRPPPSPFIASRPFCVVFGRVRQYTACAVVACCLCVPTVCSCRYLSMPSNLAVVVLAVIAGGLWVELLLDLGERPAYRPRVLIQPLCDAELVNREHHVLVLAVELAQQRVVLLVGMMHTVLQHAAAGRRPSHPDRMRRPAVMALVRTGATACVWYISMARGTFCSST